MHSYHSDELARQRQAQLFTDANRARLAKPARRLDRPARRARLRALAVVGLLAVTIGLAVLPGTAEAADGDGWYGRANTMTCVYTTVMIDARPTSP